MSKKILGLCIILLASFSAFSVESETDCQLATQHYSKVLDWDKSLGSVSFKGQLMEAKSKKDAACKLKSKVTSQKASIVAHQIQKRVQPSYFYQKKKPMIKRKSALKKTSKQSSWLFKTSLYWAFFGLLLATPFFYFLMGRKSEFASSEYDHDLAVSIKKDLVQEDQVRQLEEKIENLAEVVQLERKERVEQEAILKEKLRQQDEDEWDHLASDLLDMDHQLEVDIFEELDQVLPPPLPHADERVSNVLSFPQRPLPN